MTVDEIRAVVNRVQMREIAFEYTPIISSGSFRHLFVGHMITVDSEDETRTHWGKNLVVVNDPIENEIKIVDTLYRLALGIFEHEVGEFFKVDGVAVYNPHKKQDMVPTL